MKKEKENLTVKFLHGLPASGKSTYAKQFVAKNDNWVIVSRDSFRYMLQNKGFCEPNIESLITELFNETVLKCLMARQNVIIDNTNLNPVRIEEQIELYQPLADIEFLLFDVPAKVCIERDRMRDNPVGEGVINKFNQQYLIFRDSFDTTKRKKINKELEKHTYPEDGNAVIFDIDGTLAFATSGRKMYDWDKVDEDEPNHFVIEHLNYHKEKGRKIILTSGRSEESRKKTLEWLEFYNIHCDELIMRKADDYRKDHIVKTELYNEFIKDKYKVICVYDDRLSVVKMWAQLGIYCFCVNQNLLHF